MKWLLQGSTTTVIACEVGLAWTRAMWHRDRTIKRNQTSEGSRRCFETNVLVLGRMSLRVCQTCICHSIRCIYECVECVYTCTRARCACSYVYTRYARIRTYTHVYTYIRTDHTHLSADWKAKDTQSLTHKWLGSSSSSSVYWHLNLVTFSDWLRMLAHIDTGNRKFDARGNRIHNLAVWSRTRYQCTTSKLKEKVTKFECQ